MRTQQPRPSRSSADLSPTPARAKLSGLDDRDNTVVTAAHLLPGARFETSLNTRSDRPQLSVRERETLIEWFQCESKELVAERLNISIRTVTTYLDRVRVKYANVGRPARSKAALVARAIQDGLISPDEL